LCDAELIKYLAKPTFLFTLTLLKNNLRFSFNAITEMNSVSAKGGTTATTFPL